MAMSNLLDFLHCPPIAISHRRLRDAAMTTSSGKMWLFETHTFELKFSPRKAACRRTQKFSNLLFITYPLVHSMLDVLWDVLPFSLGHLGLNWAFYCPICCSDTWPLPLNSTSFLLELAERAVVSNEIKWTWIRHVHQCRIAWKTSSHT